MSEPGDVPVFGERALGAAYTLRPSAYALIADAHGRLAVVRTREGPFLPGGGIEGDETAEQAVVREAREEAGLAIRAGALVARAVELVPRYEKASAFLVGEYAGAPPSTPTEKDHELVWLSPDDAVAILAHESHRWAVRRWQSRSSPRAPAAGAVDGERRAPTSLPAVEDLVAETRRRVSARRSVLVALSGIDGSGKGYVTAQLAASLRDRGLCVATLGADLWLELPHVRFGGQDPAEHFYAHAFRFDELFAELVVPLRERKSLRIEADVALETATAFEKRVIEFEDVDVVLLEGIFLLKRALRAHYDLSVWIDCSFETALERALRRGQEGLSPLETERAYRTTYFPAQELHFQRDDPRSAATAIVENDARVGRERAT